MESMDSSQFSKYLTGIYQGGLVMAAIALGRELGLIQAIHDADQPFSVQDIAQKLNLKERYTLEWLSTMVAARILNQDRDTRLYTLPEAHKAVLLQMTGFAGIIFQMSGRSKRIKECFQKDGPYGVGFGEDSGLFVWLSDFRSSTCDSFIGQKIIPLWEKQDDIVQRLGIKVLDVGCGTGEYIKMLATRFPKSTFTGLDYSSAAIEKTCQGSNELGIGNVSFVEGNALNLPEKWANKFEFVVLFDCLHDLPNPHKAVEEIYKVLKADGRFSVVDINVHSDPVENAGDPKAAMFYSVSTFICLSSSLSTEPHVGYGTCWGLEEVQNALSKRFEVLNKTSLGDASFFYCKK